VLGFTAVALPIFLCGMLALATQAPTTNNMAFVLPASASPPVALALTGFYGPEYAQMRTQYPAALVYIVIGAAISVLVPAVLARRLWRGACRRFVRAVG
jgi:hypothetical protein